MINILFVDDEPNILEGLKRMLRPLRDEWEISFANSGVEALAIFEEKHIDVLVTDMKMPGMDGAQLLSAVMGKYPNVIRIILSGYSEKEMIMKTVNAAHQYLSKPCDSEMLKTTVQRVCALRNLLTNETLRQLVLQLPNVPSLPTLYTELIDELNKADPSTRIVGEIVKKDLGMTVKILQIVNSAFFGLRRRISDSKEAVEFLGLDTIGSLTLGLGIISQFESASTSALLTQLWAHSMSVGVMANKIAMMENRETANDAFTAGLLHDLGKVVLAINLPQQYKLMEEVMVRDNLTRAEAEKQIFNATHSEVGAFLLGLWGLPMQVVQAVAFHDNPTGPKDEFFSALTAVHAANAIDRFLKSDDSGKEAPDFDMDYVTGLGLAANIPMWREKCDSFQANIA